MSYRCSWCGRFVKRIKEDIGLPLLTGFPPDKPHTASTLPYAPFACYNHPLQKAPKSMRIGCVEYKQVGFFIVGEKNAKGVKDRNDNI